MNWQPMDGDTERAKIVGGWLVRSFVMAEVGGLLVKQISTMLFIPDPDHDWVTPWMD